MFLDEDLLADITDEDEILFHIWEPDRDFIALDYNNKFRDELYTDRILLDRISVVKRLGGGVPVLLQPGMLIISAVKWLYEGEGQKELYFFFHSILKSSLNFQGIQDVEYNSSNELSLKNKTFLFSTMHIFLERVFFQAFFYFNNEINRNFLYFKNSILQEYLIDNTRIANLKSLGYQLDIDAYIKLLSYHFSNALIDE